MNVHDLRFEDAPGGLLPAVVQDADDGRVLMLGYMSREALGETLARRRVVFYSRSKQRLWEKGESSGHTLHVVALRIDCDSDAICIDARPAGPTCHTGTTSCFEAPPAGVLGRLAERIDERAAEGDPKSSYTARLLAGGVRRIAQKVGEEGVEVALAAVAQDRAALVGESADLLYHLLVLLRARDVTLREVLAELAARQAETRA